MTDAEKLQLLKDYQLWRMGDDSITQPAPKDITAALKYAIQCCTRLEFISRDNPNVEQQALEFEVLKLRFASLEKSASSFGIRMKEIKAQNRTAQDIIREHEDTIDHLKSEIKGLRRALEIAEYPDF
jgi:hypothetical protein